jgi:signal transduction histidine kinase
MDATLQHTSWRDGRLSRRWPVAAGFALGIAVFLGLHRALRTWIDLAPERIEYLATALNDLAWAMACLTAALMCRRATLRLQGHERRAWQFIAYGCLAWLSGHAVWSYYELVLGGLPAFPHWMQGLFLCYSILIVIGLLLLPKPVESEKFTARHGGNLALIVCAILVVLIVALGEPAMLPGRRVGATLMSGLHTAGLTTMFVTALYLLWSHRWSAQHWPLVLIVCAAGIHTGTYIAFLHQMMTSTYVANSWFNVSWLFVFGSFACAGHKRSQPEAKISRSRQKRGALPRERWLEALIPALLIVGMLVVTWAYADWLSARVATVASFFGMLFAMVLGVREVWIQRHEQRLLTALNDSHDAVLSANTELRGSEARYRTLSAELEQRVADRTRELQQAYREMEVFAYAVAHDLKAPLRSVDGFGSMLDAEYGDRLDDKGRGYLQRMRRSVIKMAELIDDLLAYARIERREFQAAPVDLPALIERAVAEQRDDIDRCGAQVRTDIAPLAVRADADGLLLAVRNLLQNALKFSRQAKPPQIDITAQSMPEGVRIAVADNGIGFDMAHADRIFEMFQRLHRADDIPGTGIGLAIVRKAVERMHGRVWASASPGAGATFYLVLPASGIG